LRAVRSSAAAGNNPKPPVGPSHPVVPGAAGQLAANVKAERKRGLQNAANERQFRLMKSKEERDEILKKLNTFYGPFKELRTQSKLLYDRFEVELKQKYEPAGHRFSTLRYLLEGNKFGGQDEELIP
jgi:hypothetical protein